MRLRLVCLTFLWASAVAAEADPAATAAGSGGRTIPVSPAGGDGRAAGAAVSAALAGAGPGDTVILAPG